MNKTIPILLSVLSLALLQACGGGGSDSGSASPSATTTTSTSGTSGASTANTGSASSAFVRGTTARYQLNGVSSQSFGVLNASVQESSGAMTTLNTNVLSGSTTVKEIAGDASYAMGRWVAGTVTTGTGSTTLTGTDNRAYHYIAINTPAAFPASGNLTCDVGTFTAPTYTNGGSTVGSSGTATGSASLSFSANGAAIGGTVNVAASGSSGVVSFNGTIATPNGSAISGAYLSNGAGAYTQVGDAGAGAYLVASSFAVTLANGSRYIGVAKFRCS